MRHVLMLFHQLTLQVDLDIVTIISQNLMELLKTSWNFLETGKIFWNITHMVKPGKT